MGPIGPHLPCPMGPFGPCCRVPAGRTLGLLLRHLGGTANLRGRHGIDTNNTPPRWPAPVLEDDLQDQAVEQIESDTTYSDPLFAANYKAPGGTVWRRQDHKQKGST